MINIEIVKIQVTHVSIKNNIYEYVPCEKIKRITKTYRPVIQLTDTKTLLNITKQDITMAKSYNLLLLLVTRLALKVKGKVIPITGLCGLEGG